MQRELSAPALNRIESVESDDGEFYYVVDEINDEESGRQTSIGFVHRKQMSASMSNLSKSRPFSEMRRDDPRYMSTPNFIKINRRAVIQSSPMERINPRLVLHRSLKGVLKVYNNTNIRTNRRFSVANMDIFLPNGKIDPNLLAPMPINAEDKRSDMLKKHQVKAEKKRKYVLKKRKLSPIAGTPNKDAKETENKTPKHKINTPKSRLEERLKKDKFGRLMTPKKASLPDFKATGTKKSPKLSKKKKGEENSEEIVEEKKDTQKAINFLQQIQARNVLGRTIKARIAARQPPPLTRQPSKQSIESFYQDKDKEKEKETPQLKKKSSFGSLKSLTNSIKTVRSLTSRKSNEVEDEEAEMGDEITKLQNVKKDAKGKINKSSILAKTKVMGLTSRLTSASSSRSQKETAAPPPSRTASKTSIFSRSSSKNQLDPTGEAAKAAQGTPSRKSEVLRAPSASSIMSMTTAAITSNPLNTTLTITNQLATQGAEINEKKRAAEASKPTDQQVVEAVIASHPDADKGSMASQKTVSSQKTNTSQKGGSRKTSARNSAKSSGKNSAEPSLSRKGSFNKIIGGINAIRYMRRMKSNDSINSEKSDALLTMGPGAGAENEDFSAPKILEKSQKSLENVQKTVDKATSEINQTINANLTDLRKLEKKLSKEKLLEHDANNNDVEKGLSRQSTKLDMAGSSKTTTVAHMSASKTKMSGKDGMSVNAISVAPDAQSALHQQDSQESNQMNSSTR